MAKKQMIWKTKGMNKDLSVSAFNPEFAFENRNLRLSTNEGNTLMSWVNEKGTEEISLIDGADPTSGTTLTGTPIGAAVLNEWLVIFTHNLNTTDFNSKDRIYRLCYDANKEHLLCYNLFIGNLNFDINNPIETLVSYEEEDVQKVYWVDGRNQPRMINIVRPQNAGKPTTPIGTVSTWFDFIPSFSQWVSMSVEKQPTGGLFAPGVIQYCFTYMQKNGQQSNIVKVSPLYYISYADRAASPEEKVSNSFVIKISSIDTRFDYVRLYSIQRTSLNLEPVVKLLETLEIASAEDGELVYTDTGVTGSLLDPTELLFIGGKEIIAQTMADKDGTLFMGNIEEKGIVVNDIQEYFDSIRGGSGANGAVSFHLDKSFQMEHTTGIYSHTNTLNSNSNEVTTFKGGETYRFGFQLQKKTGEWTEPIFIEDKYNEYYPQTSVFTDTIKLVDASATINFSTVASELAEATTYAERFGEYNNIRPVIVYPNPTDRNVLCQGVLNPTVFNVEDRKTSSPFAQASWYFRPYMPSSQTIPSVTIDPVRVNEDPMGEGHPTSSDVAVDSNFDEDTQTHDVYIVVATLIGNNLDAIIYNGKIHYTIYKNGNYVETKSTNVEGVIYISTNASLQKKYAFVLKEPIYEPDGCSAVFQWAVSGSVKFDDHAYKLYNDMYTDNYELRYGGYSTFSTYTFNFCDIYATTNNLYSVEFSATAKNDYSDVEASNSTGTKLDYIHYSSLCTQGQITSTLNGSEKGVEIQGSVMSYGSVAKPQSGYELPAQDKSNTQFFVDQSIVTLNSPDVEFDTDVQVADTSNLKLRIVGAIPITANASAHKITISSSMLETSKKYTREQTMPDGRTFTITEESKENPSFGNGETDTNIVHKNIDICAGQRLVADYLWNDVEVTAGTGDDESKVLTSGSKYNYLIHPWHRSGSLNNDSRPSDSASSLLKTKKESNILYSVTSEYFPGSVQGDTDKRFDSVGCQMILTENAQVMNYRLPKQIKNGVDATSDINYYPNVDKILYNNTTGYKTIGKTGDTAALQDPLLQTPISMKYKSTSHAVVSLNYTGENYIPILPKGDGAGAYTPPTSPNVDVETFWGDTVRNVQQDLTTSLDYLFNYPNAISDAHVKFNYLWLGELYRDVDSSTKFGGSTKEALRNNTWCVAGEVKQLGETVELNWTVGDTYFQRYDCLKTYPFTNEDPNQLVEILSFMCETHVNIDGRYDRNRGQINNINMSPINFNLLNPVYSQRDNFFVAKKTNADESDKFVYPNQIYYGKTKTSGADVDLWTNVTLGSVLELDGDKGDITALKRFNNQIIAFQDKAISQVLYNENVQIASTTGVPIEIANSGKVQGKRYISDTIGCSNKWSIVNTPNGLYFMDGNNKGIYLFNGQLENLSLKAGFDAWSHQNIPGKEIKWRPNDFGKSNPLTDDLSAFVGYYDQKNQDVLFINKYLSLAFSEKVGLFTSFYDYGSAPYLCNLEDTGVWINWSRTANVLYPKLWKHQEGDYCRFFDCNSSYGMILVGNPEPQLDKTFTNLEFRACVTGDGTTETNDGVTTFKQFYKPFDSLEAWNEYQHGIAALDIKNGHDMALHHLPNSNDASLIRKFRIWRCDIPRDNAAIPDLLGLPRFKRRPMDRMRNPWVYMKLMKNAAQDIPPVNPGGDVTVVTLPKAEIHDVMMTYFE